MKKSKNIQTLAPAALLIASLSACSTVGKVTDGVGGAAGKVAGAAKGTVGAATGAVTGSDSTGGLDAQALASREAELNRRAAELDKRESSLALQAASAKPVPVKAVGNNYGAGDLLPPGAQPGQCFTRLWVEPKYDVVSEKILVEESSQRIEICLLYTSPSPRDRG